MHESVAQPAEIDPRIERSREQVLNATLDLLSEMGYGELTIEAVAARSGVAKSTIYRHWSGKLELVTDAFACLRGFEDGQPPPGPVRMRLTMLLREMAAAVENPEWRVSCLPALIEASARSDEVANVSRRLAEKGTSQLVQVLSEAVDAGELPPETDTQLMADALAGPILLRALFHRPEIEPDDVARLVEQILR
jgi:TetR/AcrR family transcriptional regulator of autoinduction and epiphytic fitness